MPIVPTPISDDITRRFKSHSASVDQVEAMDEIRAACLNAAANVQMLVPEGREKALALTKLEEAMFWANAGISRP